MKVQDLLTKKGNEVFTVQPDDIICKAIELFNQKHIGSLLVKQADKVVGIITERDIIKKLYQADGNVKNVLIKDVMTPRDKLVSIAGDKELEAAMDLMTNQKVRHIPVLTDGKLQGIISIGDLVKALLYVAKAEKKILENYINTPY
ncbi:MAG: CBS domain-containing protein [Candidatus Cloacimonadales bacterium]